MGLFSKTELNQKQIEIINSYLPSEFHQNNWSESDLFEIDGKINTKVRFYVQTREQEHRDMNLKLEDLINNKDKAIASNIIIFNTEIYEAKPLGMVDVGLVKKFGTASTGNRFENGMVGYAIEGAIDSTWAKNNAQFDAVNEVKAELLYKAKSIYNECNLLFKFEIDFRELGSSGNVFIYARGTACKGKNVKIENETLKIENEIDALRLELESKTPIINELILNFNKIPRNKADLKLFIEQNK